jgi:hypothetical protein
LSGSISLTRIDRDRARNEKELAKQNERRTKVLIEQDRIDAQNAAAPAVKVKTLTPVSMPAPVQVLIPDAPVIESQAVEKEIIEKEI